jgi:hypothetical protein
LLRTQQGKKVQKDPIPAEIIDLTISSPPPASTTKKLRSSSLIEYGTDDEEDVHVYFEL